MKLLIIYLTLCSLSQATYISRMAVVNQTPNANANRVRATTAFRPGVVMRPWGPGYQRVMQASSHRVPYVMYRNHPNRYSMKHYTATRMVTSPWKAATRQSVTATPTSSEYAFVRAVSPVPKTHTAHASGAIHTIPAPNLSLAEKPIVVLEDNGQNQNSISVTSEKPNTMYGGAPSKFSDPTALHLAAKIEQPIGFSKANSLTQPDFQSLVQNGAALQVASEMGLSAISLPQQIQPMVSNQASFVKQQTIPQQFLQHQSIIPQQFTLHNFQTIPNAQEFMQAAPDGIVITPNALYQPDPAFLQKLQNQLLQRFPGIEFVPYAAAFEPQQNPIQSQIVFPSLQNHEQQASQSQSLAFRPSPIQYQHLDASQTQNQVRTLSEQPPTQQQMPFQPSVPPFTQPPLVLLQNEQYTRQTPASFVVAESQNQRYVVQRETQEGNAVTQVPQVTFTNATENLVKVTSLSTPQNITLELIASESKPEGTTVKYIIETTTEGQKITPVHHTTVTQSASTNTQPVQSNQVVSNFVQANQNNDQGNTVSNDQNVANIRKVQVAESGGKVVTDSYYSAINDVRAGAALVQVDKSHEPPTQENITTTTLIPTSTISAEFKPYFIQSQDKDKQNNTGSDIKPTLGVPFSKNQNSVNVAYTLLRSDDKEAKVAKDGSVYAGQIVEASVSEDQDFNKQKANLLTRRAPIRLVAATEKDKNSTTTTQRISPKVTVKARIPPKSKLTFDDKTGEPVLRIYASYVDNAAQKEATTAKLSNAKREIAPRKQDSIESWKAANVKALARPHGFEPNPNAVTQFGLKLRSRSDDYVPLFDDYED